MIAYWLASHLYPLSPSSLRILRGVWRDGPLAGSHMGEARCQLDS
jgi:hypothetical protein